VRPISCKWVFKKKTNKDGNVHIYKTRLVVKGFKQIHNIDYDKTLTRRNMFKSIDDTVSLLIRKDKSYFRIVSLPL
jgi:hypothetical protein